MPMLKRCCCTRNLRTGTVACGIWTLVWSVMSLSLVIKDLADYYTGNNEKFQAVEELYAQYPHSHVILMWIILTISFLTFLSSVLLVVGVLRGSAFLLIPWTITVVFLVLLDAASLIFTIIIGGFTNSHIIFLLLWITTTLINIYCWLCVLSHYQEVRAGRGRASDYLGYGSQAVRYVPAVQHIHIGDGPLNYIQSSHTVYSFHSQHLYDDDSTAVPVGVVYADQNGGLEMAPVTSVPNMDHRSNGAMKKDLRMVNSQPALYDRRFMGAYEGTSSRIRTVSEGAIPEREEELSSIDKLSGSEDKIPFSLGNDIIEEEQE